MCPWHEWGGEFDFAGSQRVGPWINKASYYNDYFEAIFWIKHQLKWEKF